MTAFTRKLTSLGAVAGLLVLAACGPTTEEFDQLRAEVQAAEARAAAAEQRAAAAEAAAAAAEERADRIYRSSLRK